MVLLGSLISLIHLLGLLSAVHAIMGDRSSQGAIAWGLALVCFPYVALPAYWTLGRSKFRGYVRAHRSQHAHIQNVIDRVAESLESHRPPPEVITPAAHAAEELAQTWFVTGNHADLLIDGEATFQSIIDGIERAQHYILFQFFIVHDDQLGGRIRDALIARARDGLQVYFLYDEVGSHDLPSSYTGQLTEAGVHLSAFNTRQGRGNALQINFRNHRKVVVIDGREAWIGGHNVGDEYMGLSKKFGNWRDTHMRIEGPAALEAQLSFAEDWHWATSHTLEELSWTAHRAENGTANILIIPTGPADAIDSASLMIVHAIHSAKERIWIASPYFVPDDSVVSALQLAGLRGLDVRILIPDKPDHLLIYLAAFAYFERAGHTGVRFFRYTDGFMHQKCVLVDDAISLIGTVNMDNRSFRLNFEITAATADPAFTQQVEQMFLDDFARAREMSPRELHAKPWWFKIGIRLASLTSPIQ
jgi:cardiolipin synthase